MSPHSSTSGQVLHQGIRKRGKKTFSKCARIPASQYCFKSSHPSVPPFISPLHVLDLVILSSRQRYVSLLFTRVCWACSPLALRCQSALRGLNLLRIICSPRVLVLLCWWYTLIDDPSTKPWSHVLAGRGPYIFSSRVAKSSLDSVMY